jgi:hypothetical protein
MRGQAGEGNQQGALQMSDAWIPVISGAFALIGGYAGGSWDIFKMRTQRTLARQESFEHAQWGYRQCYRKFVHNVEKARIEGSVGFGELLDNYWEAWSCGDPQVIAGLEAFWPREKRAAKELPDFPPAELLEGMRVHATRSLKEQTKGNHGFAPTK